MVDEKCVKNENADSKDIILSSLDQQLNKFLGNIKRLSKDNTIFEMYHNENEEGLSNPKLNSDSLNNEQILELLEECIIGNMYYPLNENEISRVGMPQMDQDQRLILLSSMVSSYCTMALDTAPSVSCFENVANKVIGDVVPWINHLYGRGGNEIVHFHPEIQDGVLAVLRASLYHNYPAYGQVGYLALIEHQPIVYVADTGINARLGKYVCQKLGLGYETLSLIPCKEVVVDGEIIPTTVYDIQALEEAVKNDTHQNKRPILVLAHAGTPNFGEVDDLTSIAKLCQKYSIWMHVEGYNLAALPLLFGGGRGADDVEEGSEVDDDFIGELVPQRKKQGSLDLHPHKDQSYASWIRSLTQKITRAEGKEDKDVDSEGVPFSTSLTICPNTWFGLPPTLPYVTIVRPPESDYNSLRYSGLCMELREMFPYALPYWIMLRKMGKVRAVDLVKASYALGEYMIHALDKVPQIQMIKPQQSLTLTAGRGEDNISRSSPANLSSSTLDATHSLLSLVQSSVVFHYRFCDTAHDINPTIAVHPVIPRSISDLTLAESTTSHHTEKRNGDYLNALNTWLCQIMCREYPKIELNLVQKEGSTKVSIECCFVKSFAGNKLTRADVDEFVGMLVAKLEIMDATQAKRPKLAEISFKYANLKLVNLPYWAGLGAIHYIPDIWVGNSDNLPKIMSDQLDLLNETIVDELRGTDSAFATGKMENGLSCIGFGMITKDTNVDELAALVVRLGKMVEQSIKLSDRISSIIARGIKAATEDLEKENENKLQKEGVLRHVPVLGSLINWWNPSPQHVIKGRSFDLDSGLLEESERKAYTSKPLTVGPSASPLPSDALLDTPVTSTTPRSSVSLLNKPSHPSGP